MKTKVILDFIDAINRSDVGRILELMTDDHVFIDSQGNQATGKDILEPAWTRYFKLFPDYKIEINETFEKNSMICMLGCASGTYKGLYNEKNTNHWRIPAAWAAIVEDNKVRSWQVYADNIIVMEIVNRNN
jgi:hypothetical protein